MIKICGALLSEARSLVRLDLALTVFAVLRRRSISPHHGAMDMHQDAQVPRVQMNQFFEGMMERGEFDVRSFLDFPVIAVGLHL
jgi:hypothetical protein